MTLGEWWMCVRAWSRTLHWHRWGETYWTFYGKEHVRYTCGKVERW